jgi:hypothetical protein
MMVYCERLGCGPTDDRIWRLKEKTRSLWPQSAEAIGNEMPAVFVLFLFSYALVSRRLEQTVLTGPIVFTIVGMLWR